MHPDVFTKGGEATPGVYIYIYIYTHIYTYIYNGVCVFHYKSYSIKLMLSV